jgi:prepilin-type N-terminal cleavage/methylation domain-containing protein
VHRKNRSRSRRGFTLIELLAVIAIIALMASLLTGAVQRVRVNQMVHACEDVVSKLQAGVDNQVMGINESVVKERRDRTAIFTALVSYCGDDDRAASLLTYCRIRQAFPQTVADLAGFNVAGVGFAPSPVFTPLASISSGNVDQVSAALLYVALSQRTLQGNTFESDAATSGAQIDINLGVTCRIYKDAFSNPIGYRFVSENQLAELASPPYAKQGAVARDPFDPAGGSFTTGRLAGWGTTNSTNAQANLGLPGLGLAFDGKNKMIVVYSGGPPPVTTPITLTANGTILGYRLRSIGQRGSK